MEEKPYDIVILALSRWDQSHASHSFALAKEWSRTHRVFYIDRPYSLKDFILEFNEPKIQKRIAALLLGRNIYTTIETGFSEIVILTPRLVMPINFLPDGLFYKFLAYLNDCNVWFSIKKLIRDYHVKDYVFQNHFYPIAMPMLKYRSHKPLLNCYIGTNDVRLTKYLDLHGEKTELKVLKQTDLVFAGSKALYKRYSVISRSVHYLPNGVDPEIFDIQKAVDNKPYDLQITGTTPIIMFCGYLSRTRIDFSLLKELCEAYSNYLVVAVGKYEENDVLEFRLDQIANLILLGHRRHEAIPMYMSCAAVAIIPYLCNELNKCLLPLKLNEYLAMGLPVVTTNHSEDLLDYADVITIAKTSNEFIDHVGVAIKLKTTDEKEKRIAKAAANTWGSRVEHMKSHIRLKINEIHGSTSQL